jgi:nucleoside-diphosphate-sugar epimerase
MTRPSDAKVLLTGASGFIGSHVGAALANAGYQLICLKRHASDLRRCAAYADQATWIEAGSDGWRDQVIAARPQAVVHCAWSGTTAKERNDWALQARNFDTLAELLQTAADLPLQRFIALGSQAEYGPIRGRVTELQPLRPNTAYGATKVAAAVLLETFAGQRDLSYAWLRLFSIYGPGEGDQWFIPSLVKQFRAGLAPQLTGCEQRYDYLHVQDLAAGIVAALRQTEGIGAFNLTSNASEPLRNVVSLVQRFSGAKVVPQFGALPYRPNQSMHLEGDSTKFYQAFSFAPRITLEEGIRDYVEQSLREPATA